MQRTRVPTGFEPFIGEVLLRLRYLHPNVCAAQEDNEIVWSVPAEAVPTDFERELTYLLFRAKIYAEGQTQRAALSRMAFGT